jgi:hypothetical protein
MLQIILVGQTDLEPLLSRPELRQFQQRVSRRFRLAPLNEQELKEYIEHRLRVARGGAPAPSESGAQLTFTADAIQTLSNLSGGIPRVINILCDRALEAAHAQWLRTIDSRLIAATASTLSMPVAGAVWTSEPPSPIAAAHAGARPAEAASVFHAVGDALSEAGRLPEPHAVPDAAARAEHADVFVPGGFETEAPPAVRSLSRTGLVLAGSLVLVAAAIWFGLRGLDQEVQAPADAAVPNAASPANSEAGSTAGAPASSTPPAAAPAPAGTPAQGAAPAAAPAAGAPAAAPAGSPPALPGAGSGQRFEIVVASFRTESRAATVAAEVSALGLPIRQRVADGWQQVLAGPFASRADADRAQQRLDAAGLTGTQIVPSNR